MISELIMDLKESTLHLAAHHQGQYTLLSVIDRSRDANETQYRKLYLQGMAEHWLYALDMFGANSSTSDFTFFMNATITSRTRFWERIKLVAAVLYEGQSFPGVDVNLNQYLTRAGPRIAT